MSPIEKLVALYLVIMNVYAFALMRIDKIRAVKDRRHRIPERRLLGASALGGSLGAFAAMRMFRHKTKHAAFAAGIPVMLVVHIALLIWLESL
ncbi:DUF1294 domain-containing protein [Paenibacillus sacheonensis]|uniref:DUF1294 domain-containing protein n=1 Tax=Paenibacillus sacheonensis TaxID=742054 RepID=A0A7X4YMU3_9BACL|nr:DUF1294 domain-containing protein [Paenibacillus sacheonensis]MBM7564710.1 uncharacterized membrane protein YsdA (DUF1294 family) [Paenibacillus sacheonensis]NBC69266.1 DUF1294 domain-containing protein [Paenibacillus sacheonensis]